MNVIVKFVMMSNFWMVVIEQKFWRAFYNDAKIVLRPHKVHIKRCSGYYESKGRHRKRRPILASHKRFSRSLTIRLAVTCATAAVIPLGH